MRNNDPVRHARKRRTLQRGIEDAVVNELRVPVDFAGQGRAFRTMLGRPPQQIDVAFDFAQDRFAFPARPALGFLLGEVLVDAAVNFKNRYALGLRRVGCQSWAYGQGLCVRLKGHCIDIGTGRDLGETAGSRSRAGIGFRLSPITNGDVLVSNVLPLKPDRQRMKAGRGTGACGNGANRARVEPRCNIRCAAGQDLAPQAGQSVVRAVEIGVAACLANGGRREGDGYQMGIIPLTEMRCIPAPADFTGR